MRIALIGFVAALALCCCGSVVAGGLPSTSPGYEPNVPGHGFDVVVTEQESAVTLYVGQTLEAVLHERAGIMA